MASDFSIAQFRFLERLLVVHGHWCYKRIAQMVMFFVVQSKFGFQEIKAPPTSYDLTRSFSFSDMLFLLQEYRIRINAILLRSIRGIFWAINI